MHISDSRAPVLITQKNILIKLKVGTVYRWTPMSEGGMRTVCVTAGDWLTPQSHCHSLCSVSLSLPPRCSLLPEPGYVITLCHINHLFSTCCSVAPSASRGTLMATVDQTQEFVWDIMRILNMMYMLMSMKHEFHQFGQCDMATYSFNDLSLRMPDLCL